MDEENGGVFLEVAAAADSWDLDAPLCSDDIIFTASDKPLQDWAVDPNCLNDSESEDFLHGVDPNEVFPSVPSETDSGISEDPVATATVQPEATPTLYQVVYDISGLGSIKTEPGQQSVDVISIELDEWSSQMLFSDSCVVSEMPPPHATEPPSPHDPLLFPDLQLTEEEQKLLTQEGICLPNNLPLTKAEERILKKVRRKIRNKQSAQDSRRRRKDYIDGLENRAAACSAQNKELQRTVEQLEKRNMSLLAQLRRLQSLIKHTVSKGAQTSTCILIMVFSLGLLIMPSVSPFGRGSSADDDYEPTGVISRNILTDPASLLPKDEAAGGAVQPDTSQPPPDLNQSGPPDGGGAILHQPIENPEVTAFEGTVQEGSESVNSSTLVGERAEPLALGLRATAGAGSLDPAKPAHADEM